jgi:hypothetical protein
MLISSPEHQRRKWKQQLFVPTIQTSPLHHWFVMPFFEFCLQSEKKKTEWKTKELMDMFQMGRINEWCPSETHQKIEKMHYSTYLVNGGASGGLLPSSC